MPRVSDIPTSPVNNNLSDIPAHGYRIVGIDVTMAKKETPGSRLKALREQQGLSAQAVATEVGISRSHLSGIENGGDLPGRETLAALAAFFKVSLDFILYGINTPPEPPKTGEFVNDPDKLALLHFWDTLDDSERALVLRMMRPPESDTTDGN